MKCKTKRIMALLMASLLMFGMATVGLAKETYSKPINLGDRIRRTVDDKQEDAESQDVDPADPEEIENLDEAEGSEEQTNPGELDPQVPTDPDEDDPRDTEASKPVAGRIQTNDEGGQVNMRQDPNSSSEIITQIPNGADVNVLGLAGNWALVDYQGTQGYVYGKFVNEPAPVAPEDEPEEEEEALTPEGEELPEEPGEEVDPMANRSDLGLAAIKTWMDVGEDTQLGDTVTIFYEIENFYGWDYSVQWQREDASSQWQDVPGATASTHSFTLTEDNLNTQWRVRVDIIVPEEPSSRVERGPLDEGEATEV